MRLGVAGCCRPEVHVKVEVRGSGLLPIGVVISPRCDLATHLRAISPTEAASPKPYLTRPATAGAGADASVVPLLLRGFGWRDDTASGTSRPRHFYQQLWRAAASGGGEGGGGRSEASAWVDPVYSGGTAGSTPPSQQVRLMRRVRLGPVLYGQGELTLARTRTRTLARTVTLVLTLTSPDQLEALHRGLFGAASPVLHSAVSLPSPVLHSAISMPSPYFSARWPRPPCAACFLGPMWSAFRDRVSLALEAG